MKNNTYVAIMAGGVGSRFWPASRENKPKQFLDILGVGKSLIRLTFERFLKLCPAENIFIVTNRQYKDLVKTHLPELTDNQILCEPSRNNTAPCIAYTAFKLHDLNPNANLIVAPSDHVILYEDRFVEALEKGLVFTAQKDALLTLGIRPTRPDTGYGYINYQPNSAEPISPVLRFTEKPPLNQAKEFVDSGEYLWNAGIFVWRTAVLLQAFEKYAPQIYLTLGAGLSCYNTQEEQSFIDEHYPNTQSISVDFAIMEKADNVYTLPASFGWSDLGTWASLYAESTHNEQGNVTTGNKIFLTDTYNSLVRAPKDKLVVVGGLDDYIIVDEGDVLMIYPKNREQEIKQIKSQVEDQFGELM